LLYIIDEKNTNAGAIRPLVIGNIIHN